MMVKSPFKKLTDRAVQHGFAASTHMCQAQNMVYDKKKIMVYG